jgi:hypothetical protein
MNISKSLIISILIFVYTFTSALWFYDGHNLPTILELYQALLSSILTTLTWYFVENHISPPQPPEKP